MEDRVKPGDPIRASLINKIIRAVPDSSIGTSASIATMHPVYCRVLNSSGRDYDLGEVMVIDDYDGPDGTNPYEIAGNVEYVCDAPTWHTAIAKAVVAAEPIPDGERGLAILSGQCILRTTNTSNLAFAMIDPATTHQWKVSTSGIAKVLERINNSYVLANFRHEANLWRYKLNADSSAPASTSAKLIDLDGTEFASTITLSDVMSSAKYGKANHEGYCMLVGDAFHVLIPEPRVIQVVTDFIVGTAEITIERKNIAVFGELDLVDEIIEGTEC